MKLTLVIAALVGGVNGFVPSTNNMMKSAGLSMADVAMETDIEEPVPYTYPTINGWTADPDKFCAGLPGACAPLGNFDPLGFSKGIPVTEIKRLREAEVLHGRVGMLATLGYLVGENFHPLFGGQISGPANTHLGQVEQVAPIFFFGLAIAIGNRELERALTGWEKPSVAAEGDDGYVLLRKDYYPGDIGFDPLGLKPEDPEEFAEMQTKELQHGRLAMLASMGMIVQELVTNEPLLTTLKGYF